MESKSSCIVLNPGISEDVSGKIILNAGDLYHRVVIVNAGLGDFVVKLEFHE